MKKNILFVFAMLLTVTCLMAQPPVPTVSTNTCGPVTLTTVSPPGGTTYYWQGTSCGTLNTDANLTYLATTSGVYYINAFTSGTWSGCASVSVTVNPIPAMPTITPSSNLCGPIILTTGFSPSGTTYYWQGTTCGTDQTNFALTYTATTNGTFYIAAYSTAGGCWSACNSAVVVYYPEVVASIDWLGYWYYDTDPDVTMNGLPNGGTFSGPGVTGSVFSPSTVGPGDYVIVYEYTDGNGCYDSVHHPLHVEHFTGIADVNYDRFVSVYPNPVTDQLTIQIDALMDENIDYSIVNLVGDVVAKGSFTNHNVQQLDMSAIENGIYFVRLQHKELSFYSKIIVQK
jgi:hypothetical protein